MSSHLDFWNSQIFLGLLRAGGGFGKLAGVLIFIKLWSELPKGAEILASYDKGWEVMKRSRRLDFSLALSGTLVGPLIICVRSHAVEKISATEPAGEFWLENFSQFLLWTLKSPRKDISDEGNSFFCHPVFVGDFNIMKFVETQ